MKEKFDDSKDGFFEEKLSELSNLISSVWNRIPDDEKPKERKPTIMICGQTGVGKSTTINTLFGKNVAKIGFFSRGTDKEEVYEWESDNEHINVIDLPGLGDGDTKKEKEFREIYRKRIKEADAIILVSIPPRPASTGTIKTINLLLSEGARASHIVFGLNKLTHIEYPLNDDLGKVEIDGLIGPVKESDIDAIEEQKKAFLNDLNTMVRNVKFKMEQIVEYDSRTGWNLYKMLFACVDIIPFVVARRFRLATLEAEREIKKREIEKYENEKKRLEEMLREKDLVIRENEAETKLLAAQAIYQISEVKHKNKELKEENKELKERAKGLPSGETIIDITPNTSYEALKDLNIKRGEAYKDFVDLGNKLDRTILGNIGRGIANIVEKVDKPTAQAIRTTVNAVETVYKKGEELVKKGVNWLKKLW